MVQLTARLINDPTARERLIEEALVVLEIGYALIHLRQLVAADQALLKAVPAAIEQQSANDRALQLVEAQLTPAIAQLNPQAAAALRLLQLGLSEWRTLQQAQQDYQLELNYAA